MNRFENQVAVVTGGNSGIGRAAAERLAYFKLPGWIAFVDALPLTPSQKLQRGTLKTLSRELVAQGRAFDLRDRKKRPAAQQAH